VLYYPAHHNLTHTHTHSVTNHLFTFKIHLKCKRSVYLSSSSMVF